MQEECRDFAIACHSFHVIEEVACVFCVSWILQQILTSIFDLRTSLMAETPENDCATLLKRVLEENAAFRAEQQLSFKRLEDKVDNSLAPSSRGKRQPKKIAVPQLCRVSLISLNIYNRF